VTGTLIGGSFAIGDEVELLPQGISARVRGLQTHKQKLEQAQPGSRVAMNLSGVSVEQAARGSTVARPGLLRATTLIDAQLDVLGAPYARAPLRHNTEIKLFSGTSEAVAQLRLLAGNEIAPGASGWAQLELARPVALANGDRFIVRLPSPSLTIGGGVVVDAHPSLRYRRRGGTADVAVLARLDVMLQGSPAERLEKTLLRLGFTARDEAAARAGLTGDDFTAALNELSSRGEALLVDDVLALNALWQTKLAELVRLAGDFHAAQPLAQGISRESLRSKLQLNPRIFNPLVRHGAGAGALVDEGETVRLPSHQIRFTPEQQRKVDALLAQMRAQPFNTPLVKDCRAAVTDPVYEVLLRQGRLAQVNADVVFLRETYADAVQRVTDMIRRDGQITAAQARDAFGTTRKYALGLLEHLDEIGVTKRVGDARVLR
jgi:selenocysteine-specific elongation factor